MASEFKIATLTVHEDIAWCKYIEYYLQDGYSDKRADAAAWKDLVKEFPRLAAFDGAR